MTSVLVTGPARRESILPPDGTPEGGQRRGVARAAGPLSVGKTLLYTAGEWTTVVVPTSTALDEAAWSLVGGHVGALDVDLLDGLLEALPTAGVLTLADEDGNTLTTEGGTSLAIEGPR